MTDKKEWYNQNPTFPDNVSGISKHTWICPECRKSVRRSPYDAEHPRCPSCQKPMAWVGTKGKIPKKSDSKAWNRIRDHYAKRRG